MLSLPYILLRGLNREYCAVNGVIEHYTVAANLDLAEGAKAVVYIVSIYDSLYILPL